MQQYLRATSYFDYDNEGLRAWADEQLQDCPDEPLAQARRLYVAVRDGVRYNPYVCRPERKTFSASHVLEAGESYCIPKAVLLGALARYRGIPSRLGLADVRNHLSSPRLIEWLRSDIFRMHGYIELFLEGRWVKATPAFDSGLCRFMHLEPLEFDGHRDSIFQSYTPDGKAHMEYLVDHGTFDDVPYDWIWQNLRQAYGHLFSGQPGTGATDRSLQKDLNPDSG